MKGFSFTVAFSLGSININGTRYVKFYQHSFGLTEGNTVSAVVEGCEVGVVPVHHVLGGVGGGVR